MKSLRWIVPLVIVGLMLVPAARGQVMQQVPADALVVVKVNKLKSVSDKIAALSQKLGLAGMNPALADPLGSLQNALGMTQGVDGNGEMALVLLNVDMKRKDPPLIMLIPVTDFKAFVGGFANARTEGEFSIVKMKQDPTQKDTYIANWGKYAAIADGKDLLAKPAQQGLKPEGLTARELETKDIVAYVNLKNARAKFMPQFQEGRQKFIAQFEKNAAQQAKLDPKYMPIMRVTLNRVMDVVEQMINDGNAGTYGLGIGDNGINVTMLGEFAPSTPSAQRVAQLKGTDQPLTAGLPPVKYLMFGGSSVDSAASVKLFSEFAAPIEKELAALGPEGLALQSYVNAVKAYLGACKTTSFGAVAPTGALGQEAIFQMVAVATGDAKAILESQRQMFDSQQAVMNLVSPATNQPQMKTTYTANAKTIDGVTLNQFVTTFSMPPPKPGQPPNPQAMQAQQMMTFMYGPNGINGSSGAIGNDTVITATGVSDATLSSAIAAAKAKDAKLAQNPAVQAVSAQLPKQRLVAGYIALDNIANTAVNYAKQFGMPINFQLPQNLPPIGFAIATEGSAVRSDTYIPAQLLQSVIAAGMQAFMQMQGGQQPGGPGGL